jgi:hypothetical protein
MAERLLSWGYTTYTLVPSGRALLNANKAAMDAAIDELAGQMTENCTAVVYFGGHGGDGVLFPVDFDPDRKPRLSFLGGASSKVGGGASLPDALYAVPIRAASASPSWFFVILCSADSRRAAEV